ncbi:MAG: hypothetical protein K8W52_08490 [Deltaproteobacteria bacterium]|nr:hypothetical protein [Deltaproteobacteria bacterium]
MRRALLVAVLAGCGAQVAPAEVDASGPSAPDANLPPGATARTIALRTTITGHRLSASGASDATAIRATAVAVSSAELFTLVDLDGGDLVDGDAVQLATHDGAQWTAVGGGGSALTVGPIADDTQTFHLHRIAGPGSIASGDAIAFGARDGVHYVSAIDGGGGAVTVDAPHAREWEMFEVTLDATVTPPPSGAKAKVLAFLAAQRGQHVLAGQHDKYNGDPQGATNQVAAITGKVPALYSADFGFGAEMVDNRATMIAAIKDQWAKGAVVQLMYHTCVPTRDEYCGWDDIGGANPAHLDDASWNQLVTDGTALNQAWKARLDTLAGFLADLKAAGVAPLFRPLHEMNQGVFWWGGRGGPNGTRKLFQITHDYLVNVKGLDNIIWVWDVQDFGSLATDVNDYNPGAAYYDIAALDIYDGGYSAAKYAAMKQVAGTGLIAVGECATVPTPAELDAQPDWSFFMLWPDFIDQNQGGLQTTYAAPRVLTRDELPGW